MITHAAAGWRLRPYSEDDRHACEAVFTDCVSQFTWLPAPQTAPQSWVDTRRKVTTWVAEVGDPGVPEIVGFLMLSGRTAYVNYLLVDLDWRFCGIGQGLLDLARDHAGVPLTLDVDQENVRAIDAYRALGFAPIKTEAADGRTLIRLESP
ncbi:MAG: GNAT family N-acetyltransferase [Pseudomonadota bacterium]